MFLGPDLGLAKTIDESASEAGISSPGVFAGTPEFASPEQFAGVGVDIRSDLYSLGVTLWAMVTGKTPFRGTPSEVMHQHQHTLLPLEQLEGVPQPVVVLLEALLEKDPGRRFQNPAELLRVMPTITAAIDARPRVTRQSLQKMPGTASLVGTRKPWARFIDLGLAKAITEPSLQTAISTPGGFVGTPEFASPEQFADLALDARSDLYWLGATLWRMLTGTTPFRGTPDELMYQHQHTPLPLEELEDGSQPLLVLLEALLEKDPGRRFQNPGELSRAMPTITAAIDARRSITRRSLQKASSAVLRVGTRNRITAGIRVDRKGRA
jgi:serine/threonine protein kinase